MDDSRLSEDPDFIFLKRYSNSLTELLRSYDGREIPDRVIAAALGIKEEELEACYNNTVARLKKLFKIDPK
jgi:hypothetical protein